MQEIWRSIVDCPGYEVSNRGRVRSINRVGVDGRRVHGRILTGSLSGSTGARLTVRLHRPDGTVAKRYIHSLVLEAFIGPRPRGCVARHINDDGMNNALSNLRWGTKSQNGYDAVANGRHGNSTKTTCPRGHALAVRWGESGGRRCRECQQQRQVLRRNKKKRSIEKKKSTGMLE